MRKVGPYFVTEHKASCGAGSEFSKEKPIEIGTYPYPIYSVYASPVRKDEVYTLTKAMIDGYDGYKDNAPGASGLAVEGAGEELGGADAQGRGQGDEGSRRPGATTRRNKQQRVCSSNRKCWRPHRRITADPDAAFGRQASPRRAGVPRRALRRLQRPAVPNGFERSPPVSTRKAEPRSVWRSTTSSASDSVAPAKKIEFDDPHAAQPRLSAGCRCRRAGRRIRFSWPASRYRTQKTSWTPKQTGLAFRVKLTATVQSRSGRHVGLGERRGAHLHPAVKEVLVVGRRIGFAVLRPCCGQHCLPLEQSRCCGPPGRRSIGRLP